MLYIKKFTGPLIYTSWECGGIDTYRGQRSVLGIVKQMWFILFYDAGSLFGWELAEQARLIGQQGKAVAASAY